MSATHRQGVIHRDLKPGNVTAHELAFVADGRLIVGQAGGVRLLDPRTGASEWPWKLPATDVARVSTSADGRSAVAVNMPKFMSLGRFDASGEIVFLDVATGVRRSISSHGTAFGSLAFDASGSVLVTGGLDGAVRVGPSDGREPHLLCCQDWPLPWMEARADMVRLGPRRPSS